MLTVLSIIGTRPEGIKMAPVVKALQQYPDKIRSIVCVTGQHRQMLDSVLNLFQIRADYDLNVMTPNQTLSQLTATLISGLDGIVKQVQPQWVLAQGDTTTVLAASLVSFYHRIKIGHIEAGLRTGDLQRPFPEEMNRRVADVVADALFAPTAHSREALLKEGFDDGKIHVTGNTVIDALLDVAARPFDWSTLSIRGLTATNPLVLITAHRRESFGEPFRDLCEAIRDLAVRFKSAGVQFVYPVHLNPNVRGPVNEILSGVDNVSLIEPVDYFTMVHLMKRSKLILTDSGGVQEEAPSLGVPVLVMRDTTERPEGVKLGAVKLVGTQKARIVAEAASLLEDTAAHAAMAKCVFPYGDGKASARIVDVLLNQKRS